MATETPWLAGSPRTKGRFLVEVHGKDDAHAATRQRVSTHATQERAFAALIDILRQWSASHGAVTPGTRVTVVDMADGGKLLYAEYLGYGDTLL